MSQFDEFERKDLERCAALLEIMDVIADGAEGWDSFPFPIGTLFASDIVMMSSPNYSAKVQKVYAELFPDPAMGEDDDLAWNEARTDKAMSILKDALK